MQNTDFPAQPVLIVDDEPNILKSFEANLRADNITNVTTCQDATRVAGLLAERDYTALLLDLAMPKISGEDILAETAAARPDLPVIIITGLNDLETAVKCMKAGAFDYLLKPVDQGRLITTIRRAIEMHELRGQMSALKKRMLDGHLENPEAFAAIVTANRHMAGIMQYAEAIAGNSHPVLITGETGTGKELMAQAIHRASARTGRFVTVNAAGLDDNLFSDTLFGHAAGAFTGADRARDGLIRQAEQGTLFLDEIGDLSMPSQIKLLRLLQEREYYPLGADFPKRSNARVIVATNRALRELQTGAQFRKDLFYRLQTHHIHMPPLRERRDDLPALLRALFAKAAAAQQIKSPAVPAALPRLLAAHDFPGNIRELEAMVCDTLSHARDDAGIMAAFRGKTGAVSSDTGPDDEMKPDTFRLLAALPALPSAEELRTALIKEALRRTDGNQTAAARLVGMSQQSMHYWVTHRERINQQVPP